MGDEDLDLLHVGHYHCGCSGSSTPHDERIVVAGCTNPTVAIRTGRAPNLRA
jgi:hypothetical protein